MSDSVVKNLAAVNGLDLADFAVPFICIENGEAIEIAVEKYRLSGQVSRLATEKDDTFRLESADSQQYILKIGNPVESATEIEFQIELLRHIEREDPLIPVPRVIADIDGLSHSEIIDNAGQLRQVRLMSFLSGTPLDSTSSNAAQREYVGEILARLRLATEKFYHPAADRVLAWDVKNLLGLEHLLADVDNPLHRVQLSDGLKRFSRIKPRLMRLRTQVLHNDFSKSNIVVDHAFDRFVTGVIDFGDAVKTAVAIDVSTALLNQLPRNSGKLPDDDPFADGRDVLRGYLRVADLTLDELELIPHLVMARVVTRALLSLHLAKRFPENSVYLLRNTLQGWAQLAWFLQRSPEEISAILLPTV